MREALLHRIFWWHMHLKKTGDTSKATLLKTILSRYDIATIRRLATYSFGSATRTSARLALQYMGHNTTEETYDDVRFNP